MGMKWGRVMIEKVRISSTKQLINSDSVKFDC